MQTRVILGIMATTFYVLLFCVNVVVVKGIYQLGVDTHAAHCRL